MVVLEGPVLQHETTGPATPDRDKKPLHALMEELFMHDAALKLLQAGGFYIVGTMQRRAQHQPDT